MKPIEVFWTAGSVCGLSLTMMFFILWAANKLVELEKANEREKKLCRKCGKDARAGK